MKIRLESIHTETNSRRLAAAREFDRKAQQLQRSLIGQLHDKPFRQDPMPLNPLASKLQGINA